MRRAWALASFLLGAAAWPACSSSGAVVASATPDGGARDAALEAAPAPVDAGPPPIVTDEDCARTPSEPALARCLAWHCSRRDLAPGTWTGSLATCTEGTTPPEARDGALRLFNLFRSLASLPPVTSAPDLDPPAQRCALLLAAHGTVTHDVPSTAPCWSQDAAAVVKDALVANGDAVRAMDAYMKDAENPTTLGHRRWVLSNAIDGIGIGSTATSSCVHLGDGTASGGRDWVAWPPEGVVPLDLVRAHGLDETGWSVHARFDLSGAEVKIEDATTSADKPVTVTSLVTNYGSSFALRLVPRGWSAEPGHAYRVTVTGAAQPVDYRADVVDCRETIARAR